MTRRHVKLGWIVKDEARKAIFKRRMAGLMKKLDELNILCGVPSFMIAFNPAEQEPTIYPSRAEADKLIERFRGEPELERSREKVDHDSYLKEMLAEAQELLAKEEKCNRELGAYHLVTQILWERKKIADLTKEEVAEIAWYVQEKRDVIDRRRQVVMEGGNGSSVTGSGMSGGGPVEKPAGNGSD